MSQNFDRRFPSFFIGEHDRLIIGGKTFRLVYMTGDAVVLGAADGNGVSETFDFATLNRLNAAGKIKHDVEFYLPEDMRSAPATQEELTALGALSTAQKASLKVRYAMAQATIDLQDHPDPKIRIGKTDDALAASMAEICDLAVEYLQGDLPDPARVEQLRLWKMGKGPKPRGGKTTARPDSVHPTTLRRWSVALRKGGKYALIPGYKRRGNRSSYFTTDEVALMAEVVRKHYLSFKGPGSTATAKHVASAFNDENKRRAEKGLSALRTPSREAVRTYIQGLSRFQVLVARLGRQAAMKRMRPVGQGLEVLRPLQRVEMDEWKIDLITILAKSGLLSLFSPDELEQLLPEKDRDRWWLCVAIDCRTRVILGMQLVNNPKASAALECLRMVVSDKGHFADAVGALSHWNFFGKPETLWADNGCFKAAVFTDCCAALSIVLARTIAGQPAMRGTIESFFRTASEGVCGRLSGHTLGSAVERGDHDPAEMACLDTNALCTVLVRWIVDVYHNTPHEGLGGLTPLEQWAQDMADGNYPLHAAPDRRRKRLAFGLHLTRKVFKDGITILGIRYHSEDLATWFLLRGGQTVDIRWDHADIGAIEVCLDGNWVEVGTVHAETIGGCPFDGLHAQEWIATRRALRTRDEKQKSWNEAIVFEALKAIRDMNTTSKLAFGLIDKNWTAESLQKLEASLFDSFKVAANTARTQRPDDGYGRSIEPRAPRSTETDAAPQQAPARRANNFKMED